MFLNLPEITELKQLPLLERAKNFATRAHADQTRADGTPYITHPESLFYMLESYGVDDEVLAIAWLHDIIEDCDVDYNQIRAHFGDRVAKGVRMLTCVSENDEQRSSEEKTRHLCGMAMMMNDDARWVKLADRYHNILSSQGVWEDWRIKRYANAGRKLLEALDPYPKGSEKLVKRLSNLISKVSGEEFSHETIR